MGTIPNVSGWNSFYQTPAFHEYWINTNTVQKTVCIPTGYFYRLQPQLSTGYNHAYTGRLHCLCAAICEHNVIQDPNLLVTEECIKYMLPHRPQQPPTAQSDQATNAFIPTDPPIAIGPLHGIIIPGHQRTVVINQSYQAGCKAFYTHWCSSQNIS